MNNIYQSLVEIADPVYRVFHAKLIPTVPLEKILGVRFPKVKTLAKSIYGTQEAEDFLKELPHSFYDENVLHSSLINLMKDFNRAIYETERFLPYIDNWAVCDTLSPKCFAKNKKALRPKITEWISSNRTYTVRFGLRMLMSHFLESDFDPQVLEEAASVRSDEYYVNMMIAWFFAESVIKQPEVAIPYIEDRRLDLWTHNKAIQKSVESYRVPEETKSYLKTLKILDKSADGNV